MALRLPAGLHLPKLRRKKSDKSADGTMSLMEHLYELRRRLFFAVLGILIGTIVGFIWFGHGIPAIGLPSLSEILTGPYCAVPESERLVLGEGDGCKLLATGPFSALELQLKSALIAGTVLSSPVWLYQLWAFVTPALYSKERRYAIVFVSSGAVLFAIGAVLAYVVIREGLANAAKHAGGRNVAVELVASADQLTVGIADRGPGFSGQEELEAREAHHFGLQMLRKRVADAGGMLSVESRPGAGTRVSAQLPYAEVTQ